MNGIRVNLEITRGEIMNYGGFGNWKYNLGRKYVSLKNVIEKRMRANI